MKWEINQTTTRDSGIWEKAGDWVYKMGQPLNKNYFYKSGNWEKAGEGMDRLGQGF